MNPLLPLAALVHLACSHGPGASTDGGLAGGTDTAASMDGGAGDGGAADGGAADGGAVDGGAGDGGSAGPLCPEGLQPVPADDPDYCIFTYEAEVVDGVPVSTAGVIPAEGTSFDEARALCESVPVTAADGGDLGFMWLATLEQWLDAADGVVGEGGAVYPYGDEWRDGACATPLADGTVVLEGEVETGSYPECVSAFGVYDQLGNVWEWADAGVEVDAAGWLDAREASGVAFAFHDDGRIELVTGSIASVDIQVAGLRTGALEVDANGLLVVPDDDLEADDPHFAFKGFLVPEPMGEVEGSDFLPVQVDAGTDLDGFHPLLFTPEEDGAAVTAKVGCAWYVGSESGCRLDSVYWFHTHDFQGSISFRCASPPLR